jgi:MoaA/NifB/PqqE/SkfB family radical SAM enzyme
MDLEKDYGFKNSTQKIESLMFRDIYYKKLTNAAASILRTPPYIILFVSDECWMSCDHCWYTKSEYKKSKANNLTFDEFKNISESINSIRFLSITGGEAFLRDDLLEIIKVFMANSGVKRFDIPSSGWDTDLIVAKTEKILDSIDEQTPFRVDISIDGVGDVHDSIRNKKGAFDNAKKTLIELKKISDKRPNFSLSAITTVSNKNQNNIDEIAKFVNDTIPDGEWLVNATRGESSCATAKEFSIESYDKACELQRKHLQKMSEYYSVNKNLRKWLSAKNIVRGKIIRETILGQSIGGACAAGSLIGVIFNDGAVAPCENLQDSFGNIRDYYYSLPAIWNTDRAVEFRNKIQETHCKCTHECVISMSVLMRPGAIGRLLLERARLKD